ncbi:MULTISPECIES: hypothetical protein [Calothrix]|uniref:Uncharacterized protein n=2 Tax=Calothrix TaxID=1186 RepID=A0ABR8A6U2_9CYAN|nr:MULTISPECIES: hypothetical protein [Calothrix]MBD2195349.1 hypothetical protein [Calothrix parietina FACHB-288]MBD2223948.1 hypothetical protein [Calothrix anomala FACHB-343]
MEKNINTISNFSVSKEPENFSVLNRDERLLRLKSILSYFSYLNKNGEISDKAFEALVHYTCSIFIEYEVEARVKGAFEQKIIDFCESKLSIAIDKYLSRK